MASAVLYAMLLKHVIQLHLARFILVLFNHTIHFMMTIALLNLLVLRASNLVVVVKLKITAGFIQMYLMLSLLFTMAFANLTSRTLHDLTVALQESSMFIGY